MKWRDFLKALFGMATALTCASAIALNAAHAGSKDESAESLAPKWLDEWHDNLAARGLTLGAAYVGDNITNVSGGTGRGAIHFWPI